MSFRCISEPHFYSLISIILKPKYSPRSSYAIDPQWQRKFSVIWLSLLAFFVIISLPHLIRSIGNGRAYSTLLGISEHWNNKKDHRVRSPSRIPKKNCRWVSSLQNSCAVIGSIFYFTLPGLGLNAGQGRLVPHSFHRLH